MHCLTLILVFFFFWVKSYFSCLKKVTVSHFCCSHSPVMWLWTSIFYSLLDGRHIRLDSLTFYRYKTRSFGMKHIACLLSYVCIPRPFEGLTLFFKSFVLCLHWHMLWTYFLYLFCHIWPIVMRFTKAGHQKHRLQHTTF